MADLAKLQALAERALAGARSATDPEQKEAFLEQARKASEAIRQFSSDTSAQGGAPSGRDEDVPYADEAMNAKVEEERIAEEKANLETELNQRLYGPLKKPTAGTFEGLTPAQAEGLRKRYEESPNFREGMGIPLPFTDKEIPLGWDTYRNEDGTISNVPTPVEGYLTGKTYVPIPDKLYGAVGNAGANLMELGAAGVDKLTGDEESSATKWVQQNVSKLDAGDSLGNQILMAGGEVGVGMLTGTAVINALSKAKTALQVAETLGPVVTNSVGQLIKFVGAEAGMAGTVGSDTSTLFVGKNAMLPALETWQLPEDATEADKVLKARANVLADALILAGPLTVVGKGFGYTAGFMKGAFFDPIMGVLSESARERALVNSVLDRLASVGTKAENKEQLDEIKRELVEIIRENKEVVVDMGERQITVKQDPMQAVRGAMDLDDEFQSQVAIKAGETRGGVLASGEGTATQVATERPARELIKELDVRQGAGEQVTPSARGVIEEAEAPVRAAEDKASAALEAVTEAEKSLPVMIKNDPEMGATIVNLEKKAGMSIYEGPAQAVDDIVAGVRTAYQTMTAKKNELAEAIQGGPLSFEAVSGMFGKMNKDQKKEFINALPPDSPALKVFDQLKRQTVEVVDDAGNPVMKPKLDANGMPVLDKDGVAITERQVREETDEELAARVDGFLQDNGIDFGYMYREVRPALAEAAEGSFDAGKNASVFAGKKIRESVKYIDEDLLKWVENNGGEEAAQAAKAFKEFYVEDYAPFWRDGPLAKIGDLYRQTVGRTSQEMAEKGQYFKPVDFEQGAINTVEGSISNSQRAYAGQIVDLLDSVNSPTDAGRVVDLIISKAVVDMADTVRKQGISNLDVDLFYRDIGQYMAILRRKFPDQADRLDAFGQKLLDAQNDVETKKGLAQEALDNAEMMQENIRKQFPSFYQTTTKEYTDDGYSAYSGVFNKPDDINQVREVVSLAKETGGEEGMKQAYAGILRSKLFGGTVESGGSQAIKLGNANAVMTEDFSPLLRYGEEVYKDQPLMMSGIRSLINLTKGMAEGKRGRAFAGASSTAFSQKAQQTTDRIVLAVIGPLTRIGARVRSATGTVISTLSPDQSAKIAFDQIMSNSDEFLRIADDLMKRPKVDEQVYRDVFAWLVRSGIYSEADEMDYLLAAAEGEVALREGVDKVKQQMQEIGIKEQ